MGSVAYGVSSDTSDVDVYGWAIPPRMISSRTCGVKFSVSARRKPDFSNIRSITFDDTDALAGHGRVYDLTIYGIVKFFNLAMNNNPNIIDSLFTPVNCVLHSTRVGDIVQREPETVLAQGSLVRSSRTMPTPNCTSCRPRLPGGSGPSSLSNTAMTPSSPTMSSA